MNKDKGNKEYDECFTDRFIGRIWSCFKCAASGTFSAVLWFCSRPDGDGVFIGAFGNVITGMWRRFHFRLKLLHMRVPAAGTARSGVQ